MYLLAKLIAVAKVPPSTLPLLLLAPATKWSFGCKMLFKKSTPVKGMRRKKTGHSKKMKCNAPDKDPSN